MAVGVIALLILCGSIGVTVFCVRQDDEVLDLLTSAMLIGSLGLLIGRALCAAGERGMLAFGKVAGHYVELLSPTVPSVYFLWEMAKLLKTGTLSPLSQLPAWTTPILLAFLLIIFAAIIEKLLRAEADHRQEAEKLRKQLAAANRECSKLLVYEGAMRKLKESLDSGDVRGTEVIHRIDILLDKERQRLHVDRNRKRGRNVRN